MARQVARRQQRERVLGGLVVSVGIVVLVVAIFALREPNGHVVAAQSRASDSASSAAQNSTSASPTNTKTSSSTASRRSDSHSSDAAKAVPLVVLNNTTITGLAERAAHRFETGGWTVTSYGNYTNEIASTCAYYDPSYAGARAAAKALQRQYPAIARVEPRFAPDGVSEPLPDAPVVVVLTPDYAAA